MKKVLSIIALLIGFSSTAQNFEAGLMGGLTMSQITGDNLGGFDKPGARIGAYISYPIKRNVNFDVGMQYVQKGSRGSNGEMGTLNYYMDMKYIELPFTLNYAFKNGLIIESGIGPGILISYQEEITGHLINGNAPNTFALDFLCGLQYQFLNNLKFNLRYGNSIIPIRKEDVKTALEKNRDWYSSMVSLALIYQISR